MGYFTSDEVFEYPLPEVFEWHQRPGPLVRLWPPWSGRVLAEPSHGIEPGSRAILRLYIPGTFGFAGVEWVAEHVEMDPPVFFSDEMVKGPLKSWRHEHRFSATSSSATSSSEANGDETESGEGTRIVDRITYELPIPIPIPGLSLAERLVVNRTLARTFAYRTSQLRCDLGFHAAHPGERLTVAVAGSSGTIGTQLCALLSTGGHRVLRLVRRQALGPSEVSWDPARGTIDRDALAEADVVIHLGGKTIGGRFNRANKTAMYDSRIDSTVVLAGAIAELVRGGKQMAFICGSAIGYYGTDRGGEVLDEQAGSGDGYLAALVRDWEAATRPAADAGARVVNVRTGIVQTPAGGALAKQLPLFRLGLGGPLGSGSQWLSWISIDDIAGVFAHAALTPSLDGPLNAAAPTPVTAQDFAKTLGQVLKRPAILPVPGFGPKLLLGSEGAREVVGASQRVDSTRLVQSGYRFRQPTLTDALRHVLGH